MMLGVERDCLKQYSELNKKLLKEKQMSDKKHGNMLIDLFNELKKIQDMVDEYRPSGYKTGEEKEDKEDDTVEDVMNVNPKSLSLEQRLSIQEIKEFGNDFYDLLDSIENAYLISLSLWKRLIA